MHQHSAQQNLSGAIRMELLRVQLQDGLPVSLFLGAIPNLAL